MQRNINILNELAEFAPSLKGLSTSMPYEVPEGYFESLPLLCLTRVNAEVKIGSVPAGYFESLPDLMLSRVRTMSQAPDELDEVAPFLKTISRQPVGYVPEGYFESLTTEQAAGWFGDEIRNELKTIAPGLLKVPMVNTGSIPDGYFEELPAILVSRVQAPVRKLKPVESPLRRVMAVAAAAALIAGLWFGYNFIGGNNLPSNNATALAENELKATPQIEEALKDIDAESIAIYLNETSTTPVVSFTNPDDVESVIKTLNSETLENYLELMPAYPETKSGDAKS